MIELESLPRIQGSPDPGLGIFETFKAVKGGVILLEEHLERAEASAKALNLSWSRDAAREFLLSAGHKAQAETRIRMNVTGSETSFEVEPVDMVAADKLSERGLSLVPVVLPGGLGDIKWQDRSLLESVPVGEFEEVLLIDEDGSVLETSRGNLFCVQAQSLITPVLDGRLLPGVVRNEVLNSAQRLDVEAHERVVRLQELDNFDGMFVTGSVRGPVQVAQVGGDPVGSSEMFAVIRRELFSTQRTS